MNAGEHVEVWCVPPAAHVPYVDGSHNKVLGNRIFVIVLVWYFQLHSNNTDYEMSLSLTRLI